MSPPDAATADVAGAAAPRLAVRCRRALREHVRAHAENRPGVYRMLAGDGELLYVGKSIRVRTRLLSYFRAKRGEKAAELIDRTERIDWEYTPSEFAALLRELRLIKRRRPRFNREHKRDRGYCFIKLTIGEAAPRLRVVTTVRDDGARYYGPFWQRRRVRDAVREIADLLELRDCAARTPVRFAEQQELFPGDSTPLCLRADLARCLAPCAARCTHADYTARVRLARRFLEGDADEPLAILDERMREAAERLQFEYAATLRDRADRLRRVRDDLVALAHTLATLSFVYPVDGYDGEDRIYVIRRGTIRAELPAPRSPAQHERVADRVRAVLETPDPAPLAVDAERIAEMLLVARWFRRHPEERRRARPLDVWESDRQKRA